MSEKLTSNSARRALRIIKALKGKTWTGLSNKELAEGLNESPANITRACQALEAEGFVRKMETGNWSLSFQLLQICLSFEQEMATITDRVQELRARVQAGGF